MASLTKVRAALRTLLLKEHIWYKFKCEFVLGNLCSGLEIYPGGKPNMKVEKSQSDSASGQEQNFQLSHMTARKMH